MLDEQDCDPTLQLAEKRDDFLQLGGPQPGERLVEHQEARFGGERHRKLKLTLLAVGKLARRHRRPCTQPNLLNIVSRSRAEFRIAMDVRPKSKAVSALDLHRERNIVLDREFG